MARAVVSAKLVRRWGPGTAAIVRALVASDRPITGVALARAAGVSQPRASQVLGRLAAHLDVTAEGYVGHAAELLDLYLQRAKPTLVQPETYWYSTRSPAEQARRVMRAAVSANTELAFSADLGPDLLVPWRHPTLTVVYVTAALELDGAGLVPAEGRADASLIVRWTSDRTLLVPAASWPRQVETAPLTDPVQQWWDLLDLGGEDRAEAADRLRAAILARSIPGPR